MSPLVHALPVAFLTLAVAGGLVACPRARAALTRREPDPRVAALLHEARSFGSAYRHGVRVRVTAGGWWVGPRVFTSESAARAEIERVLQ